MTLSKCRFCLEAGVLDPGDYAKLEAILPDEYHHELCSHEPIGEGFKCALRLAGLSTEDDVQKWLAAFEVSSYLTWRKSKTYPYAGRVNKYRVDMRCHHNTRYTQKSPGRKSKNTECPATMYLVLKRSVKYSRSQDPHNKNGLMFYIKLNNDHNHQTTCGDALRRVVSEDDISKLKDHLEHGHSPSSALETLEHDCQEERGEPRDRSLSPEIIDVDFQQSTVDENDAEDDDIQEKLSQMFTSLSKKFKEDRDFYRPHLKRFVLNFEEIKTDSALISALSTFAMFNGQESMTRPKRKRYLQSSTAIGEQPNAVARQKIPLGGRRALITGRPTKSQ